MITTLPRISSNTEFENVVLFVENYAGDFPFMNSLKSQYLAKGSLSDRQWDAAGRCFRNDLARNLVQFVEIAPAITNGTHAEIDLSNVKAEVVREAPKPVAPREWSPFQQAIFDFLAANNGSLLIQAVAGSGKTTTIVEAANRIPTSETAQFLAFNASIAKELKDRLPAHVPGATFHSACLAGYRQFASNKGINNVKIYKGNGEKTYKILARMIENGDVDEEEVNVWASTIARLVGLAKNAGIGIFTPDTHDEWQNLINHFDIVIDEPSDF